jgi:IclR family pca regulon transcriptional regulator
VPETSKKPVDKSLLIEGLGKGLRVIEAFSDQHPRLTATEAGQIAGLTRTASRRYLMSLVHFGYADTDGKHYWLLPQVLRLGQSYLESSRMPRLAQPFVQRLSNQLGETANVSVLDRHEVVYVMRSNAPRVLSIGFHAGARVPAHAVAPGYAILSTFSPRQLDAWLAEHDFGRFTPHTVTEAEVFKNDVLTASRLGYWFVDQFLELGLSGLAVPLTNRKGLCQGALSVTFQRQSHPGDRPIQTLLPALQETAQALRAIL